jgi:hypothetical protein
MPQVLLEQQDKVTQVVLVLEVMFQVVVAEKVQLVEIALVEIAEPQDRVEQEKQMI